MNTIYPTYSHIYIEHEAFSYPIAQDLIKSHTDSSSIIEIEHYMDLFGRTHQNFMAQKYSPALILAVKHGNFLYPGAPFCQDFGNQYFYYTSFAMNCPFDCEYCYLQGMYASANLVLFVNQEDYFTELTKSLTKHPVYLCISYDTDLPALEKMTGFISRYLAFAARWTNLTTEIRTKSAVSPASFAAGIAKSVLSRSIMAYTLSPDEVISRFEHRTTPLSKRLLAIREAHSAGFPIRLCFDPLLAIPDFESIYGKFFVQVKETLYGIPIQDASIGVFRISDSYLKKMRKARPNSAILQYPFTNEDHICNYGRQSKKMISFAQDYLKEWIPKENIYTLE